MNMANSNWEEQELPRLQMLATDLLKDAKIKGATASEIAVSMDRGLSVTARLGEVETIEHHRSQGLGVTVYFGERKGRASTTDLTAQACQETVDAACNIAKFAEQDPFAGLPDPKRLATKFYDLDLFHPWLLDPDQAIDLAVQCESAARDYHKDITNSEGATVDTYRGLQLMANSLGFCYGYPTTRHSVSCSVIGQRDDSMQRDYWYSIARANENLESSVVIGKKAADRTIRRLQAKSLKSRKCPVIFAAEIASSLMGHFVGAISGGNLYRKSSFLLDKLGESVFPEFVHIHEKPHLNKGLGSTLVDSEGVATQPHDLINAGILTSYVLSSYSARKLDMETTGNSGGVHNLIIDPSNMGFDELLKEMGAGLIVTEIMGQGVNLVTGDYSRGVAGFWVENGEIQYPVEEITVAGNLKDMFRTLVAVGNDVDTRKNIRTGSILIEEMSVAGN